MLMHVIPSLATGGAERMLTSLVTAKRKTSVPQCVVSLMNGGSFYEQVKNSGVPLYELGMKQTNLPGGVIRLARLIHQLSPAAIQSWLYYGDLIAMAGLYLSGRRHQTRLYWGVRCTDIRQSNYSARLRLGIAACAKLSRFTDAVVANSYAGRRDHQKMGYRPPAFLVIPNGIDTTKFRPDPDARGRVRAELNISDTTVFVIHVARVDEMKDHATLAKVAAAMPEVQFAAIGSGTELLQVPCNVRRLGVRHDIPAIYAAADYLISTSVFGEGFSNVIAEGMASGVPAVATDIGDAREIIGDVGLIVPPRSSGAIVDGLRRLMAESENERQSLGRLCRERIMTHFSLESAVVNFDTLHRGASAMRSRTIEGGDFGRRI